MSSRLPRIGIVALVAILVAGCAQSTAAGPTTTTAQATAQVKVARVARGDLATSLTYSGSVQARDQVMIVPKVSGRIDKLSVDVGSVVRAGDTIAEIDSSLLKIQVAQAEAALTIAQSRLDTIKTGARAEQVAQAEANLDIARLRVALIQKGGRTEVVAQAQANLSIAQQRLALVQQGGRAELVAQAQANLDAAQARLDQTRKGATAQDLALAQGALDQAKNTLWAYQIARDSTCGTKYVPKAQCDAANAVVQTWEGAVVQAQAAYDTVKTGATPEQITQVTAAVTAAQQQLALAKQPATPQDLSQAQDAVKAAQAQLNLARQPASAEDLAQAQDAVKVAEAQLALVEQPTTPQDQQAAEGAVAQAQAQVDMARLQLADARVTAPFDGVIAQRLLAQGAMAAPTTPIVALLSSDVEILINVEEARLGSVRIGQAATITAAAYPGEEFTGTVAVLAPALDQRSRTIGARVRPAVADKLLDGMFAQVRIAGPERTAALLVPALAVLQRDTGSVVFVVSGDRVTQRQVGTGIADGTMREVLSGLSEGEEVVVVGQDNLRDGQVVVVQRQ